MQMTRFTGAKIIPSVLRLLTAVGGELLSFPLAGIDWLVTVPYGTVGDDGFAFQS